jgi:hypothetical protein
LWARKPGYTFEAYILKIRIDMKRPAFNPNLAQYIWLGILIFLPLLSFAQSAANTYGTAPVISSIPAGTACTGTPVSNMSGATFTAIAGNCTTNADKWYQFEAKSVNPTISFYNVGTTTTLTNPMIQVYSNPGTTPLSHGCGTSVIPSLALTIGNIYYIRVYSNTGGTGNFSICIRDPAPANDNCTGAVVLTSGTTCTNTAGNMQASTLAVFTIAAPNCEAGSVDYDVWYRFVAQTTNPAITLNSIGAGFAAIARMQLISWSAACTGTATTLYCGTTSINANYLTVGNTYYIRVYSTSSAAPANGFDMNFDICVTDPVITAPPYNDSCQYSINLPISGNCENFLGTIAKSRLETNTISGNCATAPAPTYDVWYRFTAISNSSEINLTSLAANFPSGRFQVLGGSCTSMTSLLCGVANTPLTVPTTVGTTYYVKVYATDPGPSPNGLGIFNICVRALNVPIVRFGNSYVNITKRSIGGVVETGDVLEIRMTINQKDAGGTLFNPRFVDNLPSNTTLLVSHPISIITNEGLPYKQYTTANDADAARYNGSPLPSEYNIRMNVGLGSLIEPVTPLTTLATNDANTTGQIIPNTNRPRGGGGVLFAVAYRVTVTGTVGQIVKVNPSRFIYATTAGGTDVVLANTDTIRIRISTNETLCANSTGLNNAVEQGGTFGNGTTLARQSDLTTPIAGYSFVPNPSAGVAIGDGRYSIVKNASPRNSTNQTARQQPLCDNPSAIAWDDPSSCNNRMYGHWTVNGDHTGTTDGVGNLPSAVNASGGYMLLVNADYVASEAYRQTINNLCPNTYYEFSAWIRNVCSTCGADSLANQFLNSADPLRQGGVVGVYPNLSFTVDGLDYYSTGEVDATGWAKRGFVFQTGSSQTSATFTIRNNSQGGGGNDWAMDDIALATCLPTMSYSPKRVDSLCMENLYVIGDTIRSVYNTYTHYRWQRKRSYESAWSDLTGDLTTTPVLINGQYEFVTNWTLPPSETQLSNNGDKYRVVVATTSTNLGNDACKFSDSSGIYSLRVMNCLDALDVKLISFNGVPKQDRAILSWKTSKETEPVSFLIEKSTDGTNFQQINAVQGNKNVSAAINSYTFNDSTFLQKKTYFRIALITANGRRVQSNTIMLNGSAEEFTVANVVNPFSTLISLDVTTGTASKIDIALHDGTGQLLLKKSYNGHAGINNIVIPDVTVLANGVYFIQVQYNGKTISRKLIKR